MDVATNLHLITYTVHEQYINVTNTPTLIVNYMMHNYLRFIYKKNKNEHVQAVFCSFFFFRN